MERTFSVGYHPENFDRFLHELVTRRFSTWIQNGRLLVCTRGGYRAYLIKEMATRHGVKIHFVGVNP